MFNDLEQDREPTNETIKLRKLLLFSIQTLPSVALTYYISSSLFVFIQNNLERIKSSPEIFIKRFLSIIYDVDTYNTDDDTLINELRNTIKYDISNLTYNDKALIVEQLRKYDNRIVNEANSVEGGLITPENLTIIMQRYLEVSP